MAHPISHFSLGALRSGVVHIESSSNRNLFSQKKKKKKRFASFAGLILFREPIPGIWTGGGVKEAGGPRGEVRAAKFMANSCARFSDHSQASGFESTMFSIAAWTMTPMVSLPRLKMASQPAKGSSLLSLWHGRELLSSRYETKAFSPGDANRNVVWPQGWPKRYMLHFVLEDFLFRLFMSEFQTKMLLFPNCQIETGYRLSLRGTISALFL